MNTNRNAISLFVCTLHKYIWTVVGTLMFSITAYSQPDCNTPMVGKGVVVDDISGDLAALLAFNPDWQNAIDGDLSNFTTIELTDVTGIGDVSLISIKDAEQSIPAGRRAGFVLDIDNAIGGLLGADVLNSLEIKTYLNNTLQETASVGGGGPAISLNLLGGQGSRRRVDFLTTMVFDEIELVFTGVASSTLLSEFQVFYAYHMEDGCNHNCVTALTTGNFGGLTATSGCTGLLCGLSDFPNPPADVINTDTTDWDEATIVVSGTAWIEIDINDTIPAGYDVGFAIANDGVLGLDLLSVEALGGVTITTYLNGGTQETFTFGSLANVGVLTGNVNLISFTTAEEFDEVRITFSALISLLNEWEVYYGFVRPDSDLDGFMDCVDACEDGDDNFDMDGDGTPDDCDNNDCFVSAGADQNACTDGTTAQLTAAPAGFNWAPVAGNPASIDNNGSITGLTGEGVYLFVLSNGTCSDTVAVNYSGSSGISLCNNPLSGSDVVVDNQPNEVINDENVVDGNLSNYASDGNFISLLLAIGGTNTPVISVKDTASTYPSGTRVGYVVSFPSGLAEVNLFDAIGIRTYLNNTIVQTSIINDFSLADVDALGSNGQQRISMVANAEFDEVELVAVGGIITVDLSLINELRVYYAFTEPDTCAGGDGSSGNATCEISLDCGSDYAANVNFERTGIEGVACALCDLNSISHLIDTDLENYTTMDLDVNALGEGSVSILLNAEVPSGAKTGFVIRINGGLLGAGVLDAFQLSTFLNGTPRESFTTNNPLVHANVLFGDSDLTYLGFTTSLSFDEVQFEVDANLLGAGLGGALDIYYAFVEFDADGDGVPDCRDKCCSGDDNLDEDGDGVPDACDSEPVAVNDTIILAEDMEVIVSVLDNDDFGANGPGGDSIQIVSSPMNGTAEVDDNGTPDDPTDDTLVYTPNDNYTGPDSLQYEICDADFNCDTAWVYFFIEPSNDPPLAVDDINVTPENSPASGNVLTNDNDPEGDNLTVDTDPVLDPVNGDVVLNPDGSYTYTPDPGFTGEDQFTYEVCDDGTPSLCDTAVVYIEVIGDPAVENLPPVANPDANQTEEDTPVTGDLLSNDSDPNGDDLVINTVPVVAPANGDVTINSDGTYTYDPDPGFTGQDVFVYSVCDDQVPALCDTAIVVIDVLPDLGNNTFAHDDAAVTNENTSVMGNVSANDFDPEGDDQTVNTTPVTPPSNGSVVIAADGSYTYTPDPGFSGNDFFTYETCDDGTPQECDIATVSIAVLPANDPPLAVDDINNTPQDSPASGNVLTNDSDPDGDNLTVNTDPVVDPVNGDVTLNPDGSYTYTPDPGFTGEDQFTYEVCDDGTPSLCDTAVVYIEVIGDPAVENLPPVANPDANQTEEDTPVTGDLLSNDSDPNGDDLVINTVPVVAPANGDVTINSDGTYTYDPDPGFTGQDVFVYSVCDDQIPALCDTAIVVIDVLPDLGNSTFANDDAAVTNENTSVMGNVSANDFDPEGDDQTVNTTPVTPPSNGSVVIAADGSYTYTPDPGFSGNDFFTYETCDDGTPQACDIATVSIAVLPVNSPPVAVDDPVITNEDTPVIIDVLANDSDSDGELGEPEVVSNPMNGGVTYNPVDSTYTYTPEENFVGVDSFTYEVCDDGLPVLCDTATVIVVVLPLIDTVIVTIPEDSMATFCADSLTVFTGPADSIDECEAPQFGGTSIVGTCLTYEPLPDWSGIDTFCAVVCDGNDLCDTTIIIVNVECPTVSVNVFLEGPYDSGTGTMSTTLNEFHVLPGQNPMLSANPGAQLLGVSAPSGQPYNQAPWNWMGNEGDDYGDDIGDIPYPPTATDWVLVSIRESDSLATSEIWKCAGVLHSNGEVTFPEECECVHEIENDNDYYIVVEHRNHLPVMSTRLTMTGNRLEFDFTQNQSWIFNFMGFPLGSGQKFVGSDYVMYAGNSEQLTARVDINSSDDSQWISDNGSIFTYRKGDHDLNGDTNATDEFIWILNNSIFTLISF